MVHGKKKRYHVVINKIIYISMIMSFPFAIASAVGKGERINSHLVSWLGYIFALVYLVIIVFTFLSFGIMLAKLF
jgi:hypothetical protein